MQLSNCERMKNSFKNIFFSFLILTAVTSYCQKEQNIWCFGDKTAISFNTGIPVNISPTAMRCGEGSASIADKNGNLLFYTDGDTAWDRNHLKMPNGIGLGSCQSASQSSLITPCLGDTNKYYLFTVHGMTCWGNFSTEGLCYSVVDMTLQGNGSIASPLGDIVAGSKKTFLTDSVSEKISAVMHADGVSYWVVVPKFWAKTFYAYHVTCNGVNPVPVISAFTYTVDNTWSGVGCMKASNDGKTIVAAMFDNNITDDPSVFMLDFNNATGQLSNPVIISSKNQPYGVEFSPNDSLIYVAKPSSTGLPTDGFIYQYQRYAPNVAATEIVVFTCAPWSLQVASNGKIYFTNNRSNAIGSINNPNKINTPGITAIALSTAVGGVIFGLPNFFKYPKFIPSISTATITICSGQSTGLSAGTGGTYKWSTGATTQSIIVNPVITTTYSVTFTNGPCVSLYEDIAYYTVIVNNSPTANAGADATIIYGDSTTLSGTGMGTYSWSPSFGLSCSTCPNPIVSPLQTSSYTLTITAPNGCTAQDVVIVNTNLACGEIYVPNVFSPISSNVNNNLECVFGDCIKNMNFLIYDRWGEKVFESRDRTICWDGIYKGHQMNAAVFVYFLNATLTNGKTINKRGNLSLIK